MSMIATKHDERLGKKLLSQLEVALQNKDVMASDREIKQKMHVGLLASYSPKNSEEKSIKARIEKSLQRIINKKLY